MPCRTWLDDPVIGASDDDSDRSLQMLPGAGRLGQRITLSRRFRSVAWRAGERWIGTSRSRHSDTRLERELMQIPSSRTSHRERKRLTFVSRHPLRTRVPRSNTATSESARNALTCSDTNTLSDRSNRRSAWRCSRSDRPHHRARSQSRRCGHPPVLSGPGHCLSNDLHPGQHRPCRDASCPVSRLVGTA